MFQFCSYIRFSGRDRRQAVSSRLLSQWGRLIFDIVYLSAISTAPGSKRPAAGERRFSAKASRGVSPLTFCVRLFRESWRRTTPALDRRSRPAGHGVHRSKVVDGKDAKLVLGPAKGRTGGRKGTGLAIFAPLRLCGKSSPANHPVPAGHGVDRSDSRSPLGRSRLAALLRRPSRGVGAPTWGALPA
jgi:hypothetical protein